ncbi:hypothetical protein F5B22DRAFT_644028 [Xylaria bambusicola]|uniref:uncharacterized protein n=1 Tax=Xylaria bambusicola TaxID=326684 RepID=UPI0020075B93|nr:uncharacterized protein F5B22DRAFT_644028 [Xylaria bambusicola]KAI0521303.1 hypothetical protein F5B22DRAFT_644028 [Xylaria bambusicola]
MCRYRKSVFQCNHSQVSPRPQKPCQDQLDFIAGKRTEPCETVTTHISTTVRVPQLCEDCESRKTRIDGKLSNVKTKMNELKRQLSEAYGDCVKHVSESGLESEAKVEDEKDGSEAEPGQLDPEEFLRRVRNEEHSHLMMLGSSRSK